MADIDTLTGDFERTTRGDLVVDPADATRQEMWLRLTVERGSMWADLTYGCRLHELTKRSMAPGIEQVAMDMARDALQPMLDAGRLTDLELGCQRVGQTRLQLSVRASDAAGRPVTFTRFVAL